METEKRVFTMFQIKEALKEKYDLEAVTVISMSRKGTPLLDFELECEVEFEEKEPDQLDQAIEKLADQAETLIASCRYVDHLRKKEKRNGNV